MTKVFSCWEHFKIIREAIKFIVCGEGDSVQSAVELMLSKESDCFVCSRDIGIGELTASDILKRVEN